MTFFGHWRQPRRRVSLPGRSLGRWIVVALGLAWLVAALVGAAGPYRETRQFCGAVGCGPHAVNQLDKEPSSIIGRRTYRTRSTDADGHTSWTTHYEVTWRRADGSRQTRDVSPGFFDKVEQPQPAVLRLWHGEVVGVEVTGGAEWFLPRVAETLRYWLYLAHFSIGVLLWGLLFGWWDGLFGLMFRAFAWMFMGVVPVWLTTQAVAYGVETGPGLVVAALLCLWFVGIGGWILYGSIHEW